MTPKQFEKWMIRNEFTKLEVFRRTGIARTTVDRYLSGATKIPRVVALACAAIERGIDVDD
jgi:hypothetical protein